jgi:aromatic ring-cleaving dioxygenase
MNQSVKPYKVNSSWMPKDFPREFDAHIYFDEKNHDEVHKLQSLMRETFLGKQVFVGELIPVAIGPHPRPMLEANFPLDLFTEVVLWLSVNRGSLSILIHPMSGDDYYDHTQGVIWLGESLELNLAIFK